MVHATDKVQVDYHAVVVTVDHDGASAPQVNVFFPPVAYLKSKDDKLHLYKDQTGQDIQLFTLHFVTEKYFNKWDAAWTFKLSSFTCGLQLWSEKFEESLDLIGKKESYLRFVNRGDTFCKCG